MSTPIYDTLNAYPHTMACEGFAWIGQSFKHCDECGRPYWEHTHDQRAGETWGERRLVPITPEMAAACKAKWEDS